jgi:hypothetical protein
MPGAVGKGCGKINHDGRPQKIFPMIVSGDKNSPGNKMGIVFFCAYYLV